MSKLHTALLAAQTAIKDVEKGGRNDHQNYDYATEADILEVVKTEANKQGLVLLTSCSTEVGHFDASDKNGGSKVVRWANVVLKYKIIHAESGEFEEGEFPGYAEDHGDKAVYKAITGANKYFLAKAFGLATKDDPEKDGNIEATRSYQSNNYQSSNPDPNRIKKPEYMKRIQDLSAQYGLSEEVVNGIATQHFGAGSYEFIKGVHYAEMLQLVAQRGQSETTGYAYAAGQPAGPDLEAPPLQDYAATY